MDEAKKRGMRVWVLDDAHFPTGFANGWIRDRYPEKGKKYLMEDHFDVYGPLDDASFIIDGWLNRFNFRFPEEKLKMDDRLLAVVASRRLDKVGDIDGTLLDLTDRVRDGILYWNLPEGHWRIYILIVTRNWGGMPDYINIIDADSVRVLIDAVYQPHYERYREDFGKTFAGFFSDEPSMGNAKGFSFDESIGRKNMVLPWSDEVPQLLEKELGSDYKRFLPCLWHNVGRKTPWVRFKYMDIVTRLYEKNFSRQIGEWCESHNVEYIGHVIEEQNMHARLGDGSGHFFRALGGQHMSGIDVIGQQIMPRYESFNHIPLGQEPDNEFFHFALAKMGASLGHIDPLKKGRTMCEIFGASGWATGVKDMKWMIDHVLVRGINHLVPHAFSPKEFPDPDCPPHFYARGRNPQYRYFRHLMEYSNRICHLLNGGEHVAPVAVLYHAEAEWSGEYMFFQKPAHWLTRSQIDYDILPSDIFSNLKAFSTRLEGDKLEVNKEGYRCLVIPYSQYVTAAVAEFIGNTTGKGIEFIFINGLPEGISDDADPVRSGRLLERLKGCTVVTLEKLAGVLLKKGIYDIRCTADEPYLRYYHYRREETDIYMFFNEHPYNEINTVVNIPRTGKVSIYNAFENSLIPLTVSIEGDTTKLPLRLSKYESVIVVFGEVDSALMGNALPADEVLQDDGRYKEYEVSCRWRISLATALEYPEFSPKLELNTLGNISSPEYFPNFSGTIRYETEFNTEASGSKAVLELGEVYEVAEVWVNGRHAGVRICPPYRFDISGLLKPGMNTLRVEVTNTLVRECRDIMSLYRALDPSGLLGPVKIKFRRRGGGSDS